MKICANIRKVHENLIASKQNKEKIYFNRPANEPFKFFSSRDKSFGILISKRDKKEKNKNYIYIFDIETERMRKIESECS